jgi:hypothetical protein
MSTVLTLDEQIAAFDKEQAEETKAYEFKLRRLAAQAADIARQTELKKAEAAVQLASECRSPRAARSAHPAPPCKAAAASTASAALRAESCAEPLAIHE